MKSIKQYVILADGSFPKTGKTLSILSRADTLVCCDGAVDTLLASSIRNPDYIVGDMDSLSCEHKELLAGKIFENPDQENNDLTKAFQFTLSLLKKSEEFEITILGSTGKREDHTLGNISLLLDYGEALNSYCGKVSIVSDYGTFIPCFDTCSFEIPVDTPVSIFSNDISLQIKSEGLAYPTDKVIFDAWWKATLNKTTDERFTLLFNHPSKVLVYLNYVF